MSTTTASETGNLRSTGNVSGHFICTWTLKNFSKLDNSLGKRYTSRMIHSDESKYERWYLLIYPGGETTGCEEFVSFFVSSHVNYEEKLKLEYYIELRNTDEKIITSEKARYTNFGWTWGYPQLIERKVLLRELKDDVLVIQVKATYTQTFVTGASGETEEYPEIVSDLMCKDMKRLLVEKNAKDVVISVGGKDLPAHSMVLTARSKVFAAMFEHDTIEKSSRRVTITDFDVDSMKSLLQFMYTGSLRNLTIDMAKDMLRAADKYDMNDLKIYCSNYLISRFDIDNIGSIAVAADMYNASKLRESAIQFIRDKKCVFDFEKNASALIGRGRLLLDITKILAKDSGD